MLGACGGGEEKGEAKGGDGAGGGARPAPAVETAVVAPRAVVETRDVTGTLAPTREARLTAQLEGGVTRVLVEEGDRVRRGQLLAQFDASVQAAELGGARSRARAAEAAAARANRLVQLGAASRAEQEEATAALREATGALRAAEARVAYGEVRSPFDGVVTAVLVDPGDVVGVGQDVAVIADFSRLRVEVPVSELDLVRLRAGDPVRATVDALPGRTFAARVRRVFPTVDPVSRQGVVEVEIPQAGGALRPGLLVRLTIAVEEAPDALAVPLDAVRRDVRDRSYVYVVAEVPRRAPPAGEEGEGGGRDGESKRETKGDRQDGEQGGTGAGADSARRATRDTVVLRRPVRVGLRGTDNWVQLLAGVRRGERVVVSGDQELSDSTRVRVLPSRPDAASGRTAPLAGGGRSGVGAAGGGQGPQTPQDASAAPASAPGGPAPNGSGGGGSGGAPRAGTPAPRAPASPTPRAPATSAPRAGAPGGRSGG